ncbi:TonB-dependent receptor [Spongiimicrobium salis]|uniref:TonB-dependent receptor n=1 Tax=Spongiimicrobium salis TaxID=1667022 RepID=UPI00374D3A09
MKFQIVLGLLSFLWGGIAFGIAQTGTIEGDIRYNGNPEPFVSVYIDGTSLGTSTNTDGRYSLNNVPYGNITLIVSSLGYKSLKKTVQVNKAVTVLNFELEENSQALDEVVVAVPGGKLQRDLVVKVEKQALSELYNASSITLAESISNIAGVAQNSTGTSIGKPVIRGLTSNRVVTYAQGTRIENQQWGAEHGLGVSNNGVQSVEVIKGPASLLYGSDAIGGVLYFVDEAFVEDGTQGFAESGFFTNARNSQNKVGVKTALGKFRFNTFLGYNSAGDFSVSDDDQTAEQRAIGQRVFNTRANEKNAKISLGFREGNYSSKLTYTYLNNFFGIPSDTPFTDDFTREFILPFQDVTQHNLAFENDFKFQGANFNLILGYAVNDRQEFNEVETAPDLHLNLGVFSYNIRVSELIKSPKFDLSVGAQGLFQDNENRGTVFLIPDGGSSENGVYGLFNYKPSSQWTFQSGLRFDSKTIRAESVVIDGVTNFADFNESYNSLNYSVGAKYDLNAFTFRFNVASGYRAPNTSELLSNGEHGGVGRIEVGDQNLVSEAATQLDFALNYAKGGLNITINPFYNTINDYIFITPTGETGEDDLPIFAYLQEDAKLYGGEFAINYVPAGLKELSVQSTAAVTYGDDSNGNPLPLITPVNFNSRVQYDVNLGRRFKLNTLFLQMQNYLDQNRVSEFELPNEAYTLINLGIQASYNKNIRFGFTVKNIFDTSYVDHLSRLKTIFEDAPVPNPGRDFTFNLRYNF